jgi:CRP-like cAMP-binding protein
MDAGAVLKGTSFFADVLDDASLDRLAKSAKPAEYDRGSVLIRESDPGDSLFVIVHGSVTVTIHERGADRRVATLRDGDIVGEMSLLTGAPRSATVTALRPTLTLEVAKPALEPLLVRSPELADHFAEMIEKRQAELHALHGPLHWLRPGVATAEIATRIRHFFAATG